MSLKETLRKLAVFNLEKITFWEDLIAALWYLWDFGEDRARFSTAVHDVRGQERMGIN